MAEKLFKFPIFYLLNEEIFIIKWGKQFQNFISLFERKKSDIFKKIFLSLPYFYTYPCLIILSYKVFPLNLKTLNK